MKKIMPKAVIIVIMIGLVLVGPFNIKEGSDMLYRFMQGRTQVKEIKESVEAKKTTLLDKQKQFTEERGSNSHLDPVYVWGVMNEIPTTTVTKISKIKFGEEVELLEEVQGIDGLYGTEGMQFVMKYKDLTQALQSIDSYHLYVEDLQIDYSNKTLVLNVRTKEVV